MVESNVPSMTKKTSNFMCHKSPHIMISEENHIYEAQNHSIKVLQMNMYIRRNRRVSKREKI